MLSFVVQNFKSHTPFLIKTNKYNEFILLNSIFLNKILLFWTVQCYLNNTYLTFFNQKIVYFFKIFFNKKIWLKFYYLNLKSTGVYTNTFTNSLRYWRVKILFNSKYNNTFFQKPIKYLKPIPILYFSFNKLRYNTFIILLLKLFVDYYYVVLSSFFLAYNFLFYNNNYRLYNFTNKYYFQIRNY